MTNILPLNGSIVDASAGASRNRLLVAISTIAPEGAAWLAPRLEPVTFAHGEVLAEPGQPFTHLYFPQTAVMSIIGRMLDGRGAEVGTVGNEGMVGISAFLEADPSPHETIAQIPGTALRLPADVVVEAMQKYPAMRSLLNRYVQEYITQVAQTAACNRLHGIELRCARWLLMTQDRVGHTGKFPLTQQYLAIMLGVRRASVTVAAGTLQDAGLIRYRRGSIRVLDRAGLEKASCECYALVRLHFDRLITQSATSADAVFA